MYVLLMVVFIVNAITSSSSPMPWMDEVQIIEMGRTTFFFGETDWSMIYADKAISGNILYYVGGLLLELFYRLFSSHGCFGPRIFVLLSLIAATFILYKTLIKKNANKWLALGVAAAFVADPIINQSVRGARVDILTVALTFSSLCILSNLSNTAECKKSDRWVFFLVGIFSVLQMFVWASSVMLLPIILVEIWYIAEKRRWLWKEILNWVMFGVIGSTLCFVILMVPLYDRLDCVIKGFVEVNNKNLPGCNALEGCLGLVKCLLKTPILVFASLLLFAFNKEKKISYQYLVWLSLLGLFAALTRVYVFRVFYLIPYFILILFGGLSSVVEHTGFVKKIGIGVLAGLILFNFAYSVILKNIIYYSLKASRNHTLLVQKLRDEVGGNHTRIYADTFQVYYAGRELDWKLYRLAWGELDNPAQTRKILGEVDFYLTEKKDIVLGEKLKSCGFRLEKEIVVLVPTKNPVEAFVSKLGYPATGGYGPYSLYRKVAASSAYD